VVFFGALLLVAGGAGIVSAFKLRGWPGMTSGVVLAGLFILTGVLMLMHPILSGLSLTLVIAAFLIAAGAASLLSSAAFPAWNGPTWSSSVAVSLAPTQPRWPSASAPT
jgi:uncharacterized membrane protein HdeD (DUF308 family)